MAQVSQVMKMSITRYEFAQALGMKHTDLFVEKMFRIIDRDKDGKISFQEFLETVTRFSLPQASADPTNQVRTLIWSGALFIKKMKKLNYQNFRLGLSQTFFLVKSEKNPSQEKSRVILSKKVKVEV